MMARLLMVKVLGALRPIDESGEEILRHIGQGEVMSLEMRRPRNIKHHRLFWALMSVVWENLSHEEYPTVEDLVTRVKIATGHRKRIEFEGGIVAFIPESIAFHNMDQSAFEAFFERVCDWVATSVLPGIKKEDLRREIEEMTGARIGQDGE